MKSRLLLFLLLSCPLASFAQARTYIHGAETIPLLFDPGAFQARLCGSTDYEGILGPNPNGTTSPSSCTSIENEEFFLFRNDQTDQVSFEISVLECGTASSGIEVALYSLDGTRLTPCHEILVDAGAFTLSTNGLEPFNHYVLWIDGISGSECKYYIQNTSGILSEKPALPGPMIARQDYCWGDTLTIQIPGHQDADHYVWSIASLNNNLYAYIQNASRGFRSGWTTEAKAVVVLPRHSTYATLNSCDSFRIEVSAVNACGRTPGTSSYTIELCTQALDTIDVPYCVPDSLYVEYPFNSGQGYDPTPGFAIAPYSDSTLCGSASILRFIPKSGQKSQEVRDTTICQFPATVRGRVLRFPGEYRFFLGSTHTGCDSILMYNVVGIAEDSNQLHQDTFCAGSVMRSGFSFNNDYPIASSTVWTDLAGNLAGQTPHGKTNVIDQPGTYEVTQSIPGCTSTRVITVIEQAELSYSIGLNSVTFYAGTGTSRVERLWLYTDSAYIRTYLPDTLNSTVSDSITVPLAVLQEPNTYLTYFVEAPCGLAEYSIDTRQIVPAVSSLVEGPTEPLTLFPNPCRGIVNVSGIPEQSVIEILDSRGRLIFRQPVLGGQLDVSVLPKGLYLLRRENAHARLVVQ